jgi:hypothetical protein
MAIEAGGVAGGGAVDKVGELQARLEFLKREEEAIRQELERAATAEKAAALAEAAMRQAIQQVRSRSKR